MTERSGLYSIQNFQTIPGKGLGGYGPTIILDGQFVQAIIENKEKRNDESPLYKMLWNNLTQSLGNEKTHFVRINFFEDTWLLTNMSLTNNCGCFGIDGNTRSALDRRDYRTIRYNPHNIDSPRVGAVIISTWLLWFNTVISMTGFELPFTM